MRRHVFVREIACDADAILKAEFYNLTIERCKNETILVTTYSSGDQKHDILR